MSVQVSAALKAAGASDPGLLRDVNEDRFHVDPARGLFVVIDGVGGQAAGEKAAETALTLVRRRLERETGTVEDRVREAIGLANEEIHRLASLHPEWKGMACVLTMAVVTNGDIVVGHVGDTRLYKLRGGRIEKLTRDHSPVGEREDAGELSEREAMQHPRRNEVYRDVGSELHRPDDPGFIDILRVPFEPDAALLLCSDGLSDLVPSAAIAEVVRDFAGHPYEVVRGLIDAALAAGGKDNVTAIYVEGPRFAAGEETRDLRSHDRTAARTAAVAEVAPAPPVRPSTHRWRTLALLMLTLTVLGAAFYAQRERYLPVIRTAVRGADSGPRVVRPGESIGAAIRAARPGDDVVVEPGEYRERLVLRSRVRVVSRVPRGAILRLPAGASEAEAAVEAVDVSGAELSGFRILGDAATPLGTGVLVRNAGLHLSDVEISGARTAAIEFAAGAHGTMSACDVHDNAGSAIVIRAGASPRVEHNAFSANASSERAAGPLLVEADAHPSIARNTFVGIRADALLLPARPEFAAIARENWFIVPPAPEVPHRDLRGRR